MSYSCKINGREYFVKSEKLNIVKVSPGKFAVEYDRTSFEVIGGIKSGGAANEWFVRNELFFGDRWLPCRSMIDAVRKGVQF